MKKVRFLVALVWATGVSAAWELGAFLFTNLFHDSMASAKLPYLHGVALSLAGNFGPLSPAAGVTWAKAGTGFFSGVVVGYLLAVLMSISRTAEKIAFPYLIASQMIPVLGLVLYKMSKSFTFAARKSRAPVSLSMAVELPPS